MSITVIQTPQKFTPSNDPIIFQVQSDNINLTFFRVEILEATTSAVIEDTNINPFPDYMNGSYIDLSRILSNLVKWEANNSQSVLTVPVTRPILAYKVRVTERGPVSGVISDLSPALLLPNTYYTWNAGLGRYYFKNYSYTNYVVNTGLPVKFLTYKPNRCVVNDFSSEQLYFMQDNMVGVKVWVEMYNSTGTLLNTYVDLVSGLASNKMYRVQISPKALQAIVIADFTDVDYYLVYLTDDYNIVKSEKRKYYYRPLQCNVKPQNLFWVNSLGGIDCYQMVNVVETNNITRNTIKKNHYQINGGYFSDRSNDILNPSEEVVDITQQGTYQANTQFITDAESAWLNELFISQQVFVELADNSLVPVIIKDTSYQTQQQYLNKTGFTTTQVTYQLNGDLIPADISSYDTGFGSGVGELDFLDSQMNSI